MAYIVYLGVALLLFVLVLGFLIVLFVPSLRRPVIVEDPFGKPNEILQSSIKCWATGLDPDLDEIRASLRSCNDLADSEQTLFHLRSVLKRLTRRLSRAEGVKETQDVVADARLVARAWRSRRSSRRESSEQSAGETESLDEKAVKLEALADLVSLDAPVKPDLIVKGATDMPPFVAWCFTDYSRGPKLEGIWDNCVDTLWVRSQHEAPPSATEVIGRDADLAVLDKCLETGGGRIVYLTGPKGIGKRYLATRSARVMAHDYLYLYWQDLAEGPELSQVLTSIKQHLTKDVSPVAENDIAAQAVAVSEEIGKRRCLVVLVNSDIMLDDEKQSYRPEYAAFDALLTRLEHNRDAKGRLLLTSEVLPPRVAQEAVSCSAHVDQPLRYFHVEGFGESKVSREWLEEEWGLEGDDDDWITLHRRFAGYPGLLRGAALDIVNQYRGDISEFLEANDPIPSIDDQLQNQWDRLTADERGLVSWLTLAQRPLTTTACRALVWPASESRYVERTLSRVRSKFPVSGDSVCGYALPPYVSGFLAHKLEEQVVRELRVASAPSESDDVVKSSEKWRSFQLLHTHCLVDAGAEPSAIQAQERTVLEGLVKQLGEERAAEKVCALLKELPRKSDLAEGYVAANLAHVLIRANGRLNGADLSGLTLRRMNLQGVRARDVNFQGCRFVDLRLTQSFRSVMALAFDPSGKYLATGDSSGQLRVWDYRRGTELGQAIHAHRGWITSVAFAQGAKGCLRFASAAEEPKDNIQVWEVDLETRAGKRVWLLEGHAARTRSLAFHPDGKRLVSGGDDGLVCVWDLKTGRRVQSKTTNSRQANGPQHQARVMAVAADAAGNWFASAGGDRRILLWRFNDLVLEEAYRLEHDTEIRAIAFSPNGGQIAGGDVGGEVRIWGLKENIGQFRRCHTAHQNAVTALVFHGDVLISSSVDRQVRLWDTVSDRCEYLRGHENEVSALAVAPRMTRPTAESGAEPVIASGGRDNTVRIWDASAMHCTQVWQGSDSSVTAIGFHPKALMVVAGTQNHSIILWKVDSTKQYPLLALNEHSHKARVNAVAFSPDGQLLASAGDDYRVILWRVREERSTQQSENALSEHEVVLGPWNGVVSCLDFDRSGALMAAGSHDGTVQLWNVRNQAPGPILGGRGSMVYCVAFGRAAAGLLAAGRNDGRIMLWRGIGAGTPGEPTIFASPARSWVTGLAFDPEDRYLYSCDASGQIVKWDVESQGLKGAWAAHQGGVRQLLVSPDGKTLASAGNDHNIRFWDLDDLDDDADLPKEFSPPLFGHENWVWDISLDDSGHWLVSGSEDGTVRIWDAVGHELVQKLRAPRPYEDTNISGATGLSEEQRRTFHDLGAVGGEWPV